MDRLIDPQMDGWMDGWKDTQHQGSDRCSSQSHVCIYLTSLYPPVPVHLRGVRLRLRSSPRYVSGMNVTKRRDENNKVSILYITCTVHVHVLT